MRPLWTCKLHAAGQSKVVAFVEKKSVYSFLDPSKHMSKPDFPTTQFCFMFETLLLVYQEMEGSALFSLLFQLPRCMVSTARLVLVLRRRSRSLQQEWCPTKLYKLLQPMPHQQQQPVQLRMHSRVTECRET